MRRQSALSLVTVLLALPQAYAQQTPAYVIQSKPVRTVEATYSFQAIYRAFKATDWVLFVAKPPDLPSQTVAKVATLPAGNDLTEQSPERQTVIRTFVRPATESQRSTVKLVVRTEATLQERRLVRLPPDKEAPAVPPLADNRRKVALAATPRMNFNSEAFQKWLDANELRKRKEESDVDFARRVFLTIRRTMHYQRPFDHDGKASTTCRAGRGDCGCMTAVFVSALRANGVPARELAGRLVESEKPFEQSEYGIHITAEFFADRIGWVPVDPTAGIGDRSRGGLTYFGYDPGHLLVLHLDGDLVVETRLFGKRSLDRLQTVALWARGTGKFENPEITEDWQIRDIPPRTKRK